MTIPKLKNCLKETLEKENVLSKLAEPWITNPDNITQINIKDSDEPGMKCLKSAINSNFLFSINFLHGVI